jgi:hypothetical protein
MLVSFIFAAVATYILVMLIVLLVVVLGLVHTQTLDLKFFRA